MSGSVPVHVGVTGVLGGALWLEEDNRPDLGLCTGTGNY